jgi:hypothetical protein
MFNSLPECNNGAPPNVQFFICANIAFSERYSEAAEHYKEEEIFSK